MVPEGPMAPVPDKRRVMIRIVHGWTILKDEEMSPIWTF